jgi:hypothetical protein
MQLPNQTLRGLIDQCDKQSSDWPANGTSVVYVRAYTNLDLGPNQTVSDYMGAYCGFTKEAQVRDYRHTLYTVRRQANPRDTLRPTLYDIASRAPANGRHVFIAMSQFGTEGLKAGGTPELKRMAEQSIILMLQTYASWLNTVASMGALVQRARILQRIERDVRRATGFQPNWRVRWGTNVSSPLFEMDGFYQQLAADSAPSVPMLVQSIYRPHPDKAGKTIGRLAMSFRNRRDGLLAYFTGYRVSHGIVCLNIHVPGTLASQIRQAVEREPSKKPLIATLVLECMDHGEHPTPYFGLPAVGGYREFGAANALGIRVEWKHHAKDEWFTAQLQVPWQRIKIAWKGLRAGDAKPVEGIYQQAIALIQLVRGEDYPGAPEGFWQSLTARGARPTIQKLEVNHMKQAMRWITVIPTPASPVVRSTPGETRSWLIQNRARLSRFMVIGERPEKQDPFWGLDRHSTLTATHQTAIRCDTCLIIKRRTNMPEDPSCKYDPKTQACPPCAALGRCCTFTPRTALLAG